jgi:aspartate/methionine/tyrosine aminotransferase
MLAEAATSRTRAIIINTPHNPTGRVFTLEELVGVAELAARRNLWVLCDESFEKFVFDGHRHLSVASLEGMKERTVLIQSFSKGFALPGARVGYLAAPKRLCQCVIRFNEHVITSVSPLMQSIAISALAHEVEWTDRMLTQYARKRQVAEQALAPIPGIAFRPTEGTFYALIGISAFEASSQVFVNRLLDEIGVACTPGAAFGAAAEGMVRINLVGPIALLEMGLRRMQAYLGSKGR